MDSGPFIVLEGPDGTGKSVLAAHLRDVHGFEVVHCGPPEKDAFRFYLDRCRAVRGPAAADRLHVGSYVYGVAFRNGPDMTAQEEWLFEGWLLARGAVLVYCIVPPEVVEKNLARGPDSEDAKIYEVPEKRALLRQLYEEYLDRTHLPVLRYDFTEHDMATIAHAAAVMATTWADGPRFEVAALGNMVTPRYVFVGDRPTGYDKVARRARAHLDSRRFMLRFAALFEPGYCWGTSPSGRYLFQSLRAAGLRFWNYCTFNSVQWDGRTLTDMREEDPAWFARVLKNGGEFVALGNLAAAELERAGIPHRKVPHPQYCRRFFYKRVLDYAALLKGGREYVEKEWKHDRF